MTLSKAMREKLATPKPGYMTTRLPRKSAGVNKALLAAVARQSDSQEGRK